MKDYENPKVEIVTFSEEDVIRTSSTDPWREDPYDNGIPKI